MNGDDGVTQLPGVRSVPQGSAVKAGPGQLEMVVTYLEMRSAPKAQARMSRAEPLAIMRARRPTLSFYRYLYDAVGARWMWYERKQMSDTALAAIISDPKVSVNVLYVDGVPAGYAELDARIPNEIELAYFGLLPEFIGRGLGRFLLQWAIDTAWAQRPHRVWVHTCNHDHPNAIAVYQRCGFVVYDQQRSLITDPTVGESL